MAATRLTHPITIRPASEHDLPMLERLAALDETADLHLPTLLAEQDGKAVAALSLSDGLIAADPFVRTGDAVALLRLRAARLTGAIAAPQRSVLRLRRHRRTITARA
ncbi:MAG: hypothetical protein JHC95_17255 [Solirubrobacteraceae bacterium]|nr:hypothetical protein [Solirubrobacteraceae bacterium]